MPKKQPKQKEGWKRELEENPLNRADIHLLESFISQELTKARVSSLTYKEGFQSGTRIQAKLDVEDVQKARKEVIEKLKEWAERRKKAIDEKDNWQARVEIVQDLQDYLEELGKEK